MVSDLRGIVLDCVYNCQNNSLNRRFEDNLKGFGLSCDIRAFEMFAKVKGALPK